MMSLDSARLDKKEPKWEIIKSIKLKSNTQHLTHNTQHPAPNTQSPNKAKNRKIWLGNCGFLNIKMVWLVNVFYNFISEKG
jgi:hypothetical protein